jgi:LmbE family N-acetylglucosaminyl deacetylase
MINKAGEREMEGIPYSHQRAMVVAPHADDETLGCGGVIQKYISGCSPVRVVVASLTLSVTKRYKKESESYDTYKGETRAEEMEKAMNLLGTADFHILFPMPSPRKQVDGRLDTMPRAELVDRLERQIKDFCPTVIYIPSITKHQDHEALHQAAVAAARPYFWNGSLFVYETDGEISFSPNLYVPLTDGEMERKLEALAAYQTQLGGNRHPVNLQSVTHKARFRGNQIYEEFAEAFQILRLHG